MSKDTRILQNQFSQAARGNTKIDINNFDEKRLKIYQELLLYNLNDVLSHTFPILLDLIPQDTWLQMLKNILKSEVVETPLFHELPLWLVNYIKRHGISGYPFAADLAHYEWVEIDVEISEHNSSQPAVSSEKLIEQTWQLNTSSRLLSYQYEVDKIGINYQPKDPQETYMIVYQKNGGTAFLKLNEMTFQLLTMMLNESMSAQEIIQAMCQTYSTLQEDELITACLPLISDLYNEKVLIVDKSK